MDSHRPANPRLTQINIPAANVLDLRKATRPRVAASKPRSEVLKRFWQRAPTVKLPPRQRFRDIQSLTAGTTIWFRAIFSRYRIGAFPILAVALLLAFASVTLFGQMRGLQSRVLEASRAGYQSLKVAGAKASSQDLPGASQAFQDARASFSAAEEFFREVNPRLNAVLEKLPVAGAKLRSGKHLVRAAGLLANAGRRFTAIAQPLVESGEGLTGAADFVAGLERDQPTLQAILQDLNGAFDELSQVQAQSLPSPYREEILRIQELLPGLRQSITTISDSVGIVATILGASQPSEYLFVFQNANELRPTGGFVGSFALIRLDRGRFKVLDAPDRGSFGIDDLISPSITPPLPLQVITPSWYFRDANWYPDWPTSAQQFARFYEQARGFKPEGVIALTHTFIERLLTVTGPINLPAYGVTVDAANFDEITQAQVERKFDLRVNDPKRFIVDLIPVIAEQMAKLSFNQYPTFLGVLIASLAAGDLQLWSGEAAVEQQIAELGWSGSLPSSNGDFLQLVDSNIGGGKTDGVISEIIRDHLRIEPDGRVTATIEVTRTHQGTPGDIFTGSRNRTYHRLYVPFGSKLLAATGFTKEPPDVFWKLPAGSQPDPFFSDIEGRVIVDEQSGTRINDEFGKTVFGNWTELDPGETKTFSFTYELPLTLGGSLARYDLTVGKQAGARNRTFELTLEAPPGTKIAWTSLPKTSHTDSGLFFSTKL
ncbi:MAG: DUF4012 domain-containing protein, partial [Candidatus Kerfeldbacteria bacterium]|nr:DUF4012 domain-containing protein [Candidatus Kerfeldbacteria bacterium]